MPTFNLTQKAVAKLPAPHPNGKQTIYWCDELRGFGVQCSGKTNQRLYIAQRDLPGGKARRVTIGPVSGLALNVARQRAENVLDDLRRGVDPKYKAPTFTLQTALNNYITARPNLALASIAHYRQIERVLEAWLNRDLKEITPEMVENRHRAIAKEIGTATANVNMRTLRIVWNFAADRTTLPSNPVLRLRRQWYAEPRRTRMVQTEELPAFYSAVMALPNPTARDYVLLMLFTGMRRGEAAALCWSHVDLTQKILRVPAELTKAKRKLEIPMSDFVHDLLVKRRALGSVSDFLFPGPGATKHITSADNALAMVADATGIQVSAHDLRRTYASVAESADLSWLVMKTLLNHATRNDVTAGYVQISIDRLREPVQRVCDKLKALCGITPVAARNVTKLRRENSA
ncbi:MAG: tyrosine-type recombinase/integrase [Bradyrhizobium sp.]|uniref:tyrosine-type recombinase/integrase n=1 Tax=Bradyrhizobium sp. TaxID=376 RepID=UPI002725114A|nr:tyrosine-type recombinase/integrase [Bradyrhizobium sp.]MDO8396408.1 tyrosine-type recombinase/integrase [Bradyrhizobium sp.]